MSSEELSPEEKLLKVIQNGGQAPDEQAASDTEEAVAEEAIPLVAAVVDEDEAEPALTLKSETREPYKAPVLIGQPVEEDRSEGVDRKKTSDEPIEPPRMVGIAAEESDRSASRGLVANLRLDRIFGLFSIRGLNVALLFVILFLIARGGMTVYTIVTTEPELPEINPAEVKKLPPWKDLQTSEWGAIRSAVAANNIFGPNKAATSAAPVARAKPRWKNYVSQNIVIYAKSGTAEVILRDNKESMTYILGVGDVFGPPFDQSRIELKRITSGGVILAMDGEEVTL